MKESAWYHPPLVVESSFRLNWPRGCSVGSMRHFGILGAPVINRRLGYGRAGRSGLGVALALVAALFAQFASSVLAADLGAPLPEVKSGKDYYNGIPLGGWIFYPSLILAGTYNDNIYRSYTNRVSAWGAEVIPSFTAELNDGIHKTTIYGTM